MQHVILYQLISSVIKKTILINVFKNCSIIAILIFMVDLLLSNHSSGMISYQEGNS